MILLYGDYGSFAMIAFLTSEVDDLKGRISIVDGRIDIADQNEPTSSPRSHGTARTTAAPPAPTPAVDAGTAAGNGSGNRNTDTDGAAKPVPVSRVENYPELGITVDWSKKTARMENKTIEFERSEVQWHIFKVALKAHPGPYLLSDMMADYPGNSDVDSRKSAVTSLNDKLKRFGLQLKNRVLKTR